MLVIFGVGKVFRSKRKNGGKEREILCILNVAVSHGPSYFVFTKTSDRESIVETRLLVVCAYSREACWVNNSSREYSE